MKVKKLTGRIVPTLQQDYNMEIKRFRTRGPTDYVVFYTQEMEGGGTWFGQEYIEVLKTRYPDRVFERCYEWCSGPGFIGYALLDHGVCKTLCLSDIYDPAIQLAQLTSKFSRNQCADRVTAYLFRDLALLPNYEQFDLVVANPPHHPTGNQETLTISDNIRIEQDPEWQSHRNFFQHIKNHLSPDGIILLQENAVGSTAESFQEFIDAAGLKICDSFPSPNYYLDNEYTKIYYLEVTHK